MLHQNYLACYATINDKLPPLCLLNFLQYDQSLCFLIFVSFFFVWNIATHEWWYRNGVFSWKSKVKVYESSVYSKSKNKNHSAPIKTTPLIRFRIFSILFLPPATDITILKGYWIGPKKEIEICKNQKRQFYFVETAKT